VPSTRIVLVRHGESVAQERRLVGGHVGCKGLSERGRSQVRALADRLARTRELAGATALYSSVMARAVETADILAPVLGLEVRRDCAFCEHHPGEGDGLSYEEYARRWPMPERFSAGSVRCPGSESFDDMRRRVAAGLDGLVDRHRGETVVVACHGGVIVHSMVRWLGIRPDAAGGRAWLNPTNSGLTEWRFTSDDAATGDPPAGSLPHELVRFDDAAHLATADLPATPRA
jgi:broad specificity phosphatase PhoE